MALLHVFRLLANLAMPLFVLSVASYARYRLWYVSITRNKTRDNMFRPYNRSIFYSAAGLKERRKGMGMGEDTIHR